MAVSVERVQGFALGFTDNPDLTGTISDNADNYGIAAWARFDTSITAPTRNGEAFTELLTSTNYGYHAVYGQVPDVGTFTVDTSSAAFKMTAGVWLVLAGVDTTTPVGTVVTENEDGASWTAPSLAPTGATGDLLVSILLMNNWDAGFSDTSSATITPGGSQTLQIDRPANTSAAINEGRVIVTTAPVGTTLTYSVSGGIQPTYAHIAFAVKAASGGGGGATPALGRYRVAGPIR